MRRTVLSCEEPGEQPKTGRPQPLLLPDALADLLPFPYCLASLHSASAVAWCAYSPPRTGPAAHRQPSVLCKAILEDHNWRGSWVPFFTHLCSFANFAQQATYQWWTLRTPTSVLRVSSYFSLKHGWLGLLHAGRIAGPHVFDDAAWIAATVLHPVLAASHQS